MYSLDESKKKKMSKSYLGNYYSFLFKHGKSEHNLKGLIGGDADLSVRGKLYAEALANYIKEQNIEGLRVWTPWLKMDRKDGKL
jgi:bisphosphoglycerate-dependent phosphoglycerate mutase